MPSKQARDFAAALAERLQERARTLLAGDEEVLALLRAARDQIVQLLAAQPSDFAQWQLARLRDQLDLVLRGAGQQAGVVGDQLLRNLWQQGEDFVDKPLAAAGLGSVEMRLGALDVRLLAAMRTFALDRLADVTAEAAGKIGQQLGLVTLGAVSPFEAIKKVQGILGEATPARASRIVLTEASRAFAAASQQRLAQSAELVPGMGKQWRRSGKAHSRWQHDLMDGQVVGAGERFKVPSPNGGVDLMLGPHDPAAPADQVINCGCVALPHMRQWQVMHPGAKPFTARELERDPGKAQLDRQAKAAGLRIEGPYPAYEMARAGGTHEGWYRDRLEDGDRQLAKGLSSIESTMDKHRGWIASPVSKVADWAQRDPRYQEGLLAKWQEDLRRQGAQADILKGILAARAKTKPK